MKQSTFIFVLLAILLASCMLPEPPLETEIQTLALSVSVKDFQPTGYNSTRAVAMSTEEKAIHTLYVIQFDGTATTSQVVKSGFASFVGSHYVFDFQVMNKSCVFYFLVNLPNFSITAGTTMNDFLRQEIPFYQGCFQGMPMTGLPMFNSSIINPSIYSPILSVTLKPLVARLTLNYNVDPVALNLVGGQAPDIHIKGYLAGCFGERPSAQTSPWFPVVTTDRTVNLGSNPINTTFYVAENMAGENNDLPGGWMFRPAYAKSGAMHIQLDCPLANGIDTYYIRFYIGDQRYPKDFNIRRGYAYDVALSVQKLDTNDPRVSTTP